MLDQNSRVPLYFQLQEKLRKQILEGYYKPGDLIPCEKDLQKMYGISRITVRNAIHGLVFEDLLVKKQGYGTIVAYPKMTDDGNSRLQSFTEKMAQQGVKIATSVLEVLRIPASERIAEHLRINPGDPVIYAKRLRLVEDEPVAVFENYLATSTGVTEEDDFSKSIYDLLEGTYHIQIGEAAKIIEADIAGNEVSSTLGISKGDPILIIRHTTYATDGSPVEYAEGVYRADRYKHIVTLKR